MKKRTTIWIEDGMFEQLRRAAYEQRSSMTALIDRALVMMFAPELPGVPAAPAKRRLRKSSSAPSSSGAGARSSAKKKRAAR